ncbi:hypothetical protein BRC69_03390, partial [Halobacteriales archaeon QH_6_66_25]
VGRPRQRLVFSDESMQSLPADELLAHVHPSEAYPIGSIISLVIDPDDKYYLVPSSDQFDVAPEEVEEVLSHALSPAVVDGQLQSRSEFLSTVDR